MLQALTRVFGSRNDRLVKNYTRLVREATALEPRCRRCRTRRCAPRPMSFARGCSRATTLDQLLSEAFAVVREAARRTLKMRHFDVQLVGGMALHQGKIAEMRTGEGKTLMSTLPAYLNALPGEGVHVVTVNEYLAQRDADWMGPVYRFLGLTVGVIKNAQDSAEKRAAYACDITYGTNNEFGFDYLRDNLAYRLEDRVQRSLSYAIVDEVDSILIDEARTPLIISGPGGGEHRGLHPHQRAGAAADAPAGRRRPGRLLGGREGQAGAPDRGRPRARRAADGGSGAAARGREPVRHGQHPPDASPERSVARARALQARRRVHRARRRSHHRR